MTIEPKRTLSKIRTFEQDVAAVTGSEYSEQPQTTVDSQNSTEQNRPSVTPTTKQSTPTTPEPTPATVRRPLVPPTPLSDERRATDFLQTNVPPVSTVAATPIPTASQPKPTLPEDLPTASTPPRTRPSTSLEHALSEDIKKQTTEQRVAPTNILDGDSDLEIGSIVTDKKTNRFKLLPALVTSIQTFGKKLIAAVTPTPNPGTKITSAASRRDVITTAAKRSHNVPSNDFATIKKIKATTSAQPSEPEVTKNLQIKDVAEVTPTGWSHYRDDDTRTEETSSVAELEITPTPEEALTPFTATTPSEDRVTRATEDTLPAPLANPEEVAPLPPTALEEPELSELLPRTSTDIEGTEDDESTSTTDTRWAVSSAADSVEPDTTATLPEDSVLEPAQPEPTVTLQTETARVANVSQPLAEPTFASSFPTEFRDPTPTHRLAWLPYVSRFAIVFVLLGAIGLGVSTAIFWFGNFDQTATDRVISVPSLIPTNQQLAIPLGSERVTLLEQLAANTVRATEVSQFYPVYDITSEPVVPANTNDILTALSFRIPGNLERSITSATFGSTGTNEPFLILRVQDFDTTFAGMLTWEAAMSADLDPWFGETVVQSFDENARTDNQLRPAFFSDRLQDNANLRVLTDEQQAMRITYGFITPQLVLITTSPTTFSTLRDRIQGQ